MLVGRSRSTQPGGADTCTEQVTLGGYSLTAFVAISTDTSGHTVRVVVRVCDATGGQKL